MNKKSAREALAITKPQKPLTDEDLLAAERQKNSAAEHKREARRIQKALEKENSALATRLDFFNKLSEAKAPKPLRIRRRQGKANDGTYVMLGSDWHVGERVRPDHVGGKNEYTPEIAQERAEQFFISNVRMLEIARAGWHIDKAVFWLGGDLMTGYIHEEYEEENFLSPVEEALLAQDILIRGIDYLLVESDLEEIIIPTSNGNHGRTQKKMRIATYAKNSFEWMLYHMLARHYEGENRLRFRIANGYNNVLDVYGVRLNFSHGDAVRGGGGVGGIAIPLLKRVSRIAMGTPLKWEGTDKAAAHYYIEGHHHQTLNYGPLIKNGSLIGWNDFAEWLGCGYEPPCQTSFVLDSKYTSINNYNPIFVEKGKK